jgi:uncharacterized protein
MKYTLAITQKCNLACDYCYIKKNNSAMELSAARRIVDFIFGNVPLDEKIDIGFFGGEPLLEFELVKNITGMIQTHERYDPDQVTISVTTNGTILSEHIMEFIAEKNLVLCISCDGPPAVQDRFRRFPDGRKSSPMVENNIKQALSRFPMVPVNSVYGPDTLESLPDIVDYLASLGVRSIYLNPDISAHWTEKETDALPRIYNVIGEKYLDYYMRGTPKYISIIDGKITVILRGGYKPLERCRMGKGEFAFAPSGNVYPCERFIGSDDGRTHCLGNINDGLTGTKQCQPISATALNRECQTCGLRDYCMNWCGCTNYFGTGEYAMVSPFICASEKAAIKVAFEIIQRGGEKGLNLAGHLAGMPMMNVVNACS